ncbi:MAG: DUF2290 domain-containing protein [Nodularia sp. (in: Bacteria)]|nr:MAG: DUF2290 domain-containing protein [Nodularia sp. (in: cyanobacteria)]
MKVSMRNSEGYLIVMKINDVWEELEKIKKVYRELIVTTNYKQINNSEIGWDRYTPGIEKNLYAREYETLLQNRQYSFLLNKDMGFIQIYFKYKDETTFDKIKMAYYPYPIKLREDSYDIDRYLSDSEDLILQEYYFDLWNILNRELGVPVEDKQLEEIVSILAEQLNLDQNIDDLILQKFNHKYEITNSSHIRIDYSPVTSHHVCEIQIGAINNIRLPLDRLVSPFLFFDFIIKNIYRKSYSSMFNNSTFKQTFIFARKKSYRVGSFNEDNIFITHL